MLKFLIFVLFVVGVCSFVIDNKELFSSLLTNARRKWRRFRERMHRHLIPDGCGDAILCDTCPNEYCVLGRCFEDDEDDEDEDDDEDDDDDDCDFIDDEEDEQTQNEEEEESMQKHEYIVEKTMTYRRLASRLTETIISGRSVYTDNYKKVDLLMTKIEKVVDECIDIYETGSKFGDVSLTMASDAVAMVVEIAISALSRVLDHFARAPYSEKNTEGLLGELQAVERKIGAVKNYIYVNVGDLVYRPLDDEESLKKKFEAGLKDLRAMIEAEIQSANNNIRVAEEMIKSDRAKIQELKGFHEMLKPDDVETDEPVNQENGDADEDDRGENDSTDDFVS